MWDELLEEKQAAKLGPTEWSCNCHTPITASGEQVFTRMYPTKVDMDGVCLSCGHYALKIESRVLGLKKQRSKFKLKRGVK